MSRAILVGSATEATLTVYIDATGGELPYSKLANQISEKFFLKKEPEIRHTEYGGILPDIDCPLIELDLENCKKIISLL